MEFLRPDPERPPLIDTMDGFDLHGPKPAGVPFEGGDYFRIWRDDRDYRMTMSTFTPTYGGISIHARLAKAVVDALADYLVQVGFAQAFE